MFSYQHHIGDFNKATRHLTRIERSIYRDMLDLYYETESPLPLDIKTIERLIIAKTNEEVTAVEQVLNEFFHKNCRGWVHVRCEFEIERYKGNSTQKSKAGKASAAARAAKRQQIINGELTHVEHALNVRTNGDSTESQRELNVESTNHQPQPQPSTNNNIVPTVLTDSGESGRVPVQQIVDLFNAKFPELAKVQKLTAKRRKAVIARWGEFKDLQSVEAMGEFFDHIRKSDFLMSRGAEEKTWLCFDWIFTAGNFLKIYEGNYHGGDQ